MYRYCVLLLTVGWIAKAQPSDSLFVPFSNATIQITVKDNPADTVFLEAGVMTIIPRDYSRSNLLYITDAGEYYLNLVVDRPAKAQLFLGDEMFYVFVVPQDTIRLNLVPDNGRYGLQSRGRAEAINRYYSSKKKFFGTLDFVPRPTSNSSYISLMRARDSTTSLQLSFFHGFQSSSQLPPSFIDFEEAEILYEGASLNTGLPLVNDILKIFEDSLEASYFEFLKNVEIDNPKAIYSFNYVSFLDDYFLRNLPASKFNHLSGFDRLAITINHNVAQAKKELTGSAKRTYLTYNFTSLLSFFADSLKIDSLAKAFDVTDYSHLMRLSGSKSKNGIVGLNLARGDVIPDFFVVDDLDSMQSLNSFEDRVVYLNFWATWCGPCIQNFPALNAMIKGYKNNPSIAFINICLDSPKERWLTALSRYHLGGVNFFAEGNWNKKLRSYFNIKGIPHYVILNKGKILHENFTEKAPTVKVKIDALLNEKHGQ